MTVVASLRFLISPLADIAVCLQVPLTKRGRGILSENYKSEHCGKRRMRMPMGCVTRRDGISFFLWGWRCHVLQTYKRCVSSAECFIFLWSHVLPSWISASNFMCCLLGIHSNLRDCCLCRRRVAHVLEVKMSSIWIWFPCLLIRSKLTTAERRLKEKKRF